MNRSAGSSWEILIVRDLEAIRKLKGASRTGSNRSESVSQAPGAEFTGIRFRSISKCAFHILIELNHNSFLASPIMELCAPDNRASASRNQIHTWASSRNLSPCLTGGLPRLLSQPAKPDRQPDPSVSISSRRMPPFDSAQAPDRQRQPVFGSSESPPARRFAALPQLPANRWP